MATKIETLKKPNGDQVLPRTRAKAVSMEDGTSVEAAIVDATEEISNLNNEVAVLDSTINLKQNTLTWLTEEDVDAMFDGTYESVDVDVSIYNGEFEDV